MHQMPVLMVLVAICCSCVATNNRSATIRSVFLEYKDLQSQNRMDLAMCSSNESRIFISLLIDQNWLVLPGDSVWACKMAPGEFAFLIDSERAKRTPLSSGDWLFVLDTFTREPPRCFCYDGQTGRFQMVVGSSGIYDERITSIKCLDNKVFSVDVKPKHINGETQVRQVLCQISDEGILTQLTETSGQ